MRLLVSPTGALTITPASQSICDALAALQERGRLNQRRVYVFEFE